MDVFPQVMKVLCHKMESDPLCDNFNKAKDESRKSDIFIRDDFMKMLSQLISKTSKDALEGEEGSRFKLDSPSIERLGSAISRLVTKWYLIKRQEYPNDGEPFDSLYKSISAINDDFRFKFGFLMGFVGYKSDYFPIKSGYLLLECLHELDNSPVSSFSLDLPNVMRDIYGENRKCREIQNKYFDRDHPTDHSSFKELTYDKCKWNNNPLLAFLLCYNQPKFASDCNDDPESKMERPNIRNLYRSLEKVKHPSISEDFIDEIDLKSLVHHGYRVVLANYSYNITFSGLPSLLLKMKHLKWEDLMRIISIDYYGVWNEVSFREYLGETREKNPGFHEFAIKLNDDYRKRMNKIEAERYKNVKVKEYKVNHEKILEKALEGIMTVKKALNRIEDVTQDDEELNGIVHLKFDENLLKNAVKLLEEIRKENLPKFKTLINPYFNDINHLINIWMIQQRINTTRANFGEKLYNMKEDYDLLDSCLGKRMSLLSGFYDLNFEGNINYYVWEYIKSEFEDRLKNEKKKGETYESLDNMFWDFYIGHNRGNCIYIENKYFEGYFYKDIILMGITLGFDKGGMMRECFKDLKEKVDASKMPNITEIDPIDRNTDVFYL